MNSANVFYPRKLLTLEILRNPEDLELSEIISNLESPLKLALILINAIFYNNGEHLKDRADALDETKKVAFGLGSAERLFIVFSDKLAMYSYYQFAFQQFVQSSFRARQGKALEEILKKILTIEEMGITPEIGSTKDEKIKILTDTVGSEKKAKEIIDKHDIDVLATVNDKVIILQMRSRDDTGGATAKPSLAELLKKLKDEELSKEILYIIYIWVKPRAEPQQKITLINKLLSMINLENETEIKEKLKGGKVVQINEKLKTCIIYGAEELIKTLWSEFGVEIDNENYRKALERYKIYLELLSTWDDLWLAYAIATLELENLVKYGRTNVSILSDKLRSMNLEEYLKSRKCLNEYEKCSAKISKDVSPLIRGDEDIIPFDSLGDKINYIRDVILLRIVYEHLEEISKKLKKLQQKGKEKNEAKSSLKQVDITQFLEERGRLNE